MTKKAAVDKDSGIPQGAIEPTDTSSDVALAVARLAEEIREIENKTRSDFLAHMWRAADLLADGLANSGLVVTRYKSMMAEALGRSESYVDKYLRLARVSAQDRTRAEVACRSFRQAWTFLFPSPAKVAAPSTGSDDEVDPMVDSPDGGDQAPESRLASPTEVDQDDADASDAHADADGLQGSDVVESLAEEGTERAGRGDVPPADGMQAVGVSRHEAILQVLRVATLEDCVPAIQQLQTHVHDLQLQLAEEERKVKALEKQLKIVEPIAMDQLLKELGAKSAEDALRKIQALKEVRNGDE